MLFGCQEGDLLPPSGDNGPAKAASAPAAKATTKRLPLRPVRPAVRGSQAWTSRAPTDQPPVGTRWSPHPRRNRKKPARNSRPSRRPPRVRNRARRNRAVSPPPSGEILVEPPKLPDLGPPLVDHPENLTRLDPVYPVWINGPPSGGSGGGPGFQARLSAEFFACSDLGRGYEAVVVVNTRASIVHAALLAVCVVPGHPVQFDPEYKPPMGQEIAVNVVEGQGRPAAPRPGPGLGPQHANQKAMRENWVFAGSGFWRIRRPARLATWPTRAI